MTVHVCARSLPTKSLLALVLVFLLSTISGCSISNSSESISNSISSPSDWSRSSSDSSSDSSGSSSGDDDSGAEDKGEEPETQQDAASYAADVTQLAYTYGKQGGDIGALRNGVSGLASKRGITNWEVDPLTCQSIGQGVGKAGMSEEEFTKFSKSLFGDDLTKANELRKGYDMAKPPGVSAEPAAAPASTQEAAPGEAPDASTEAPAQAQDG